MSLSIYGKFYFGNLSSYRDIRRLWNVIVNIYLASILKLYLFAPIPSFKDYCNFVLIQDFGIYIMCTNVYAILK